MNTRIELQRVKIASEISSYLYRDESRNSNGEVAMARAWNSWHRSLAEHWEIERSVFASSWPVPAFIVAILTWDITTRESHVYWAVWGIAAIQIALLVWLLWLRFVRPRD